MPLALLNSEIGVFVSVIVIIFKVFFCLKMHQNNIFFFKNHF